MNNYDSHLYERAKELECLYQVDEVLQNKGLTLPDAMKGWWNYFALQPQPVVHKFHYGMRLIQVRFSQAQVLSFPS